MQCPNCNKNYEDDFDFCPYCGTKKPEPPKPKTCPECGFQSNKYSFCPKCGEKLLNDAELEKYRIKEEERRRKEQQKIKEEEERKRKEEERIKRDEEYKKTLLNLVETSLLTTEKKSFLKNEIEKERIDNKYDLLDLMHNKEELEELMWEAEKDEMLDYIYENYNLPGPLEDYLYREIDYQFIDSMDDLKRKLPKIIDKYYSGELKKEGYI